MPKSLSTVSTLVASQSVAAGGTVRGRIDASAADGGLLTLRITNGATGPTSPCVGRVLAAHGTGTMPAAASAGTGPNDWKLIYEFAASLTALDSISVPFSFGPEYGFIEVEFTGHTGQAITAEAHATTFTFA